MLNKFSNFMNITIETNIKNIGLICCFILLSAFTCENEPLEGEFGVDTNISCDNAAENLTSAESNYINSNPEDSNYTQLCLAYKVALQDYITSCGDDGTLQTIYDNLGDCGESTEPDNCETATTAANDAETAFNNADSTNYSDLCNAYKTALQDKVDACGDDGSIQAIINNIGNCEQASEVEISLTAGTLPIEFDLVNVVEDGNILKVTGNTSANGASNYEIYFEVETGATGVDIINSTFYLTLTSTFYPDTSGFDDFTSNITTNYTDVLVGTFGGIVTNADNGNLSLTSGVININY